MVSRLLLTCAFVLFFPACYLAGQKASDMHFERFTTADGLSHNTINGVTQDAAGYIWSATPAGINRYNGSQFVQFHSTDDSLSPASEEITGMAWLDKDRLAFFTGGLHIVNTKTGETRNLFIPYHDKLYEYKFNMIERVLGDSTGNIYVLSRSGFYHFNKQYQLQYRFDYYSEQEVLTEHFFFSRDLFILDSQRLLIVSINGLYIYDKVKKQVKKMQAEDCPLLSEFLDYPGVYSTLYRFFQPQPGSFFVMKLLSDSIAYVNIPLNKKVISLLPFKPMNKEFHYRSKILGVSDSLFYLTGHFSGFYKLNFNPASGYLKLYPEKKISAYLCNDLFQDKDHNLWAATNKGLLRQSADRRPVQLALLPDKLIDSFPDIRIDDVYAAAGKLYVGARGQGGLLLFDKKTLQFEKQVIFKKHKDEPNTGGNTIDAIVTIDSLNLLLGSDFPLFLYNTASGKVNLISPPTWQKGDWVNDLYKDSRGNVWMSAHTMYRYHPVEKKFTPIASHRQLLSIPSVIEEDRDGNIWMAGHGLARYNTSLDSFDLLLENFPFIKMPDKQVPAMVIDHQNKVWFNSSNNGLIAYDIRKKSMQHFTRNNGLPDNNITSMIVIGNQLWMSFYSAIACMNLVSFEIETFGKEDGIPAMPVVGGSRMYYDTTNRKLYIGFAHAVVSFDPHAMLHKRKAPRVFIESLLINGKENHYLPDDRIVAPWRNNAMVITIGSINFHDGKNQRFAYRFAKTHTTPWQNLGSQPSFNISHLPPGIHRIQVKVSSPNNHWPPQVKEISIVISPPFWMAGWFILLLLLAITVLLYLFIRWRTDIARKKEMEKTRVQTLIAEDYKNQFELEQISHYFSSSLAGKNTEAEVLWDVAGNLIARMNYVDCMIYLWNDDKSKMIQKAAYGPKGSPEHISQHVFDVLPGQGVVGYVTETMQPVLIADTSKDSRYRVDEMSRLSEICVPIIHNGELMGIIDSEHHEPNHFKERDLKILTTIATLIGNKLKQLESARSLEAKGKELATINEKLAEARLAALQAQMNPHFIFNALNSIKRMILDRDNDKASRYLSKFAAMIRMTLNQSKETFVSLEQNILYLRTYLDMEQLRFDDSFTYDITVAEDIDITETAIPSLMIQPLVENAIWHGLLPSKNYKRIQIGFTLYKGKIACIITDNGIGISQAEKQKKENQALHQSVGLENLKKRIHILNEKYGIECLLQIMDRKDESQNESGTKVILQFNQITI